jgi:surfeit locus 1 family protein
MFAIPFLTALCGVLLMTGLGIWQLERREWKLALIERMNARIHAEPVPLARAMELWRQSRDPEYTRVHITGHFLHNEERYLYTVADGQQGWSIITPLATGAGGIVLVNRGFVPDDRLNPVTRKEGLSTGIVELNGRLRASERLTWFTPANNTATNRWFWRDIPGLIASLKAGEAAAAAPFLVEAEATPQLPGGWPRAGVTQPDLPNRHLEYALTWFTLAGALAAIFAIHVYGRLHEPPSSARSNVVPMIKRDGEH